MIYYIKEDKIVDESFDYIVADNYYKIYFIFFLSKFFIGVESRY